MNIVSTSPVRIEVNKEPPTPTSTDTASDLFTNSKLSLYACNCINNVCASTKILMYKNEIIENICVYFRAKTF